MRDRRRIFSLRRTDLRDEVWVVDIRWVPGLSDLSGLAWFSLLLFWNGRALHLAPAINLNSCQAFILLLNFTFAQWLMECLTFGWNAHPENQKEKSMQDETLSCLK